MNSLNARYEHTPDSTFVPSSSGRVVYPADESGGHSHGDIKMSERKDGKENLRNGNYDNRNNSTEDGDSDANDEVVLWCNGRCDGAANGPLCSVICVQIWEKRVQDAHRRLELKKAIVRQHHDDLVMGDVALSNGERISIRPRAGRTDESPILALLIAPLITPLIAALIASFSLRSVISITPHIRLLLVLLLMWDVT